MYTIFPNIWFVIWLVTTPLSLLVKLKGQETILVSSAGVISSSSNQIQNWEFDPPAPCPYFRHLQHSATISAQCNHLKNSCFVLPSHDIWV
jgi:hypothetical protein